LQRVVSQTPEVVSIEAEVQALTDQFNRLEVMNTNQLRVEIAQNFPNPVLTKLMQEEADAQQHLVELKADYDVNHPKYVNAKEVLDTIDKQIDEQVEAAMNGLTARIAADTRKLHDLERQKSNPQMAANAQSTSEQSPITDEEEKEIRHIRELIRNSPDLINRGDWTPLDGAAKSGWLRVATFLLDHGANIEADSGKALNLAAESGNKAMVELLLNRGAEANAPTNGKAALHTAAEKGFVAVGETLLDHKADVNARDSGKRTPLHLAAQAGQVETTKLLLARGADVNAKDFEGYTPLMDALRFGHVAAVGTLLVAKADVNVVSGDGATALTTAAAQGFEEIVKSILDAKADPNGGTTNLPLTAAIQFDTSVNRSNICRMLLQAGADPNRADPARAHQPGGGFVSGTEGTSLNPIQRAVILGQTDIVKLLLNHHADANAPGIYKKTLLWEAIAGSRTEMAEALLAHGADANARGEDDETPLVWVVAHGDSKIVEALLEHGADVNAHSGDYAVTALHTAVSTGNLELMELLISHKADVNSQDKYSKTPLNYAKQKEQQGQAASASGVVRPLRPLRLVGGTSGPTWVSAPPEAIIKLLREYGAVDQLPNFNAIRVTREGLSAPILAFVRQSNDWNHYTSLETLMPAFSGEMWVGNTLVKRSSVLKFPDLRRIIIHRPNRSSLGKQKEITVDLLNSTNGIDCGKDVPVEFGDIVEIPIRDYSLGEEEVGLTPSQWSDLKNCLKSTVRLVVRGESRELTPNVWSPLVWDALQMPEAKSLLLASADLAQVKVTRKDPSTGKTRQFIVDATARHGFQDLRLENGDTIEVPEKARE
jgi:ankyrin repeat protein